jgi:hypothetical protein
VGKFGENVDESQKATLGVCFNSNGMTDSEEAERGNGGRLVDYELFSRDHALEVDHGGSDFLATVASGVG